MRALTILLCCGLLYTSSYSVIAETININKSEASLGIVNGDIINNEVKIEHTLSNPILLSITQKKLRLPLRTLFINDVSLLKNSQGKLIFMQYSPVKHGGEMKAKITVGLWLDGHRVNLIGSQNDSAIKIIIPSSFELLELRVIKPLELMLPKNYRGKFNFSLDIEGKSN